MKKVFFLALLFPFLFQGSTTFGQIVGDNVFLQGQWLEVAIAPNGSWGNSVVPPATYHTRGCVGDDYTDPGTGTSPGGNGMDFSYDAGHDGWGVMAAGSYYWYGAYFLPGTPFDGWSMQVNGVRCDAYYTDAGYYHAAGGTLTGSITGYTNTGGRMTGTWSGTAGVGSALQITQTNILDTFASWLVVSTKFVNTGATPQTGIYYFVSADPDNDEDLSCLGESGSFPTNNHIAYKGDFYNRHEVWGRPPSAHQDAFSGLATKDCRAKVLIYESWPPPTSAGNNLDLVWAGTESAMGTTYYTLGATTLDQDIAYGMIFNVGDLAPGDSTIISYAWIFSDTLAIDSAFPSPQIVTQGTAHDSLDTIIGCDIVGLTVPVTLKNATDKDWSLSNWTWSPATALSATTGSSVIINLVGLSGPITYTVTGTKDTAHGACGQKVFLLYVTPCFHATSDTPCLNGTLHLVAHGDSLGATYFWYGPSGFTAYTQTTTRTGLTWADTGVYYVVKTLAGVSDTVSTDVHIRPIPSVTPSSNGPICSGPGNTLLLSATLYAAGETFAWSGPNGFGSVLQNPSITNPPTEDGGLYKVVTSMNGCMDSAYLSVVIDSTPALPSISSNGPLCSGHRDTLRLYSGDASPGVSYLWSGPAGFVSALQNPTIPDPHEPDSGVYRVTVSILYDVLTCSNTNTVDVVVDSTPYLPLLGSNGPICSQNTLLLTATSTDGTPTYLTNYVWAGPNSFTSVLQNPTIPSASTFATGVYSVTATIVYLGIPAGCTSDTATLIVVVDSTPLPPTVSSNSPGVPSICQGDTLKLTSSDGTSGVSYSWSGPNTFASTLENPDIVFVTPAATGTYTVTAILGMCSTSSVTTVSITPTPIVTGTNNGPVCTGVNDTLFLQATSFPGTTFSWSGPYTFVSAAQNITRTPVIMEYAGVYQVIAYLNGCPSLPVNDTVIVRQTPPAPWVKWLTYCQDYMAPPLQASGDSILWYPSAAPGTPGSLVPPVPPTGSDTVMWFYATQTLQSCMSAMDSIKVTVNPKPGIGVTPALGVCPRDTAILSATSDDPTIYFHWAPATYLSDTVGPNVVVRPETDVTYTVVATNKYGCTDTANIAVSVKAGAVLTIGAGDSIMLYPGQTFQFNPQSNCTTFTWFPPSGLDNANISNPIANPQISTEYFLYGITDWGCKAEDSVDVVVNIESLLALPNAFTPGSGANSMFKIIKTGIATLRYFRIFDRWGIKVFETTDIDAGWDGTYNGTPQPFGVYVYEVSAVTSAGQTFEKHGNVTLVR